MSRVLNCIVAVCPDLGIGKNGTLPWHPIRLSKEFKHFQKMTMTPSAEGKKNVVIMGRNTWYSIPVQNRPLKNRINVVLSRELKAPPEGAHYLASDLSSALHLLDEPELKAQADQVWIIGGSSLYKEVMESSGLRRLFVTRIQKQFDCDTFIPDINPDKFRLLPEFPGVASGLQEENGLQIPLFCSSFHRLKHLHGWVSSSPGPSSSSPLCVCVREMFPCPPSSLLS
ncbi:dihydrofolate reductase isoform X2 [Silurus meridionalis]|uniref:dihydrofolate reductase isoform X2 n=1 Tax=Silurus meridionalis TaxID=175797 RepID=UPI001EE9D8F7|nr:dihydrofolate reductase isoform X2 [Silurus meridionalis]